MKTISVLIGLLMVVAGCSSGSDSGSGSDAQASFRLINNFTGPERPLGIVEASDGATIPMLIVDDQFDSHSWTLNNVGNGLFTIVSTGERERLALTLGEQPEGFAPVLSVTSDADSQLWQITPLENATCRITPFLLGSGQSLDIKNDDLDVNLKIAESGDFSGQYWRFSSLNELPIDAALSDCLHEDNSTSELQQDTAGFLPTEQYQRTTMNGFELLINPVVMASEDHWTNVRQELDDQLQYLVNEVPPNALAQMISNHSTKSN